MDRLVRSTSKHSPLANVANVAAMRNALVKNERAIEWTGGCQCGAVRYQLLTPPDHASICHCRMCQRACGQPFMTFARVSKENLRWTRGSPSVFRSSNIVERGFCSACGTPLSYRRVESDTVSVTICSLDDPEPARPVLQFGVEGKLSWTGALDGLPTERTEDWMRENNIAHIESRQHVAQQGG